MKNKGGPLSQITVIEFAGLGPAPFTGMMLADMGARVIRIDRPVKKKRKSGPTEGMQALTAKNNDVLSRGRESITLNLKEPESVEIALKLIEKADALIEGFRPGVMESLGLGPDICQKHNPALVYGRVTGWGQTGPLAHAAGHDINYTALSGALHSCAGADHAPYPTPGLIGDFGGGGMLLAFGLLAGIIEARSSGLGQVVDASISDGSALLTALIQGWHSTGLWNEKAGTNNGDGGAHFYNTYQCADGKFISIGSMEPQFYQLLREKCNLNSVAFNAQWDQTQWPALKENLADIFRKKTRQEWCDLLEGTDACFAPVLSLSEAPLHPHNMARNTFAKVNGVTQPAPAPRFSRTPADTCKEVGVAGAQNQQLLKEIGYSDKDINRLTSSLS